MTGCRGLGARVGRGELNVQESRGVDGEHWHLYSLLSESCDVIALTHRSAQEGQGRVARFRGSARLGRPALSSSASDLRASARAAAAMRSLGACPGLVD